MSRNGQPTSRHFAAAPWPTVLRVVSTLGTLLLGGTAVAAWRAIPVPTGFTHAFGVGVAMLPLAALAGCLVFVVRGYEVEGNELRVQRLLGSTRVRLDGLARVWVQPAVCRGSIRVFGNAGLFSFTGLYRSRELGLYRLFGTDLSRAVVLLLPRRTVVVTPASPEAFVEHLERHLSGLAPEAAAPLSRRSTSAASMESCTISPTAPASPGPRLPSSSTT